MDKSHQRIILIGGSQRSGTTLVQTLIANSTNCLPQLPEAHVICDLLRVYKRAKILWNKSEIYFVDLEELRNYFFQQISAILNNLHTFRNHRFLILKDPGFVDVSKEIFEIFPESIFVCCVRDPRDVVASFIDVYSREDDGNNSIYSGFFNISRIRYIRRACYRYVRSYQEFINLKSNNDDERIYYMFYENLTKNTTDVLKDFSDRFSIDLQLDSLDKLCWLNDEKRHQKTWISDLEDGVVTDIHVGRYIKKFRKYEISLIEHYCSDLMLNFNYRKEPSTTKWHKLIKIKSKLFNRNISNYLSKWIN